MPFLTFPKYGHHRKIQNNAHRMPTSTSYEWIFRRLWSKLYCTISFYFHIFTLYTLLKPKRHSLRCHGFVVHALLLRMHTNVVDFRVMRRLCHREWNWQWNWKSVNQHSWDPRQRTTWSRCVTSDFNSVLLNADWADSKGKRTIWKFERSLWTYLQLDTKPCWLARWRRSIRIQLGGAWKGIRC